jgi:hypothetical protein
MSAAGVTEIAWQLDSADFVKKIARRLSGILVPKKAQSIY